MIVHSRTLVRICLLTVASSIILATSAGLAHGAVFVTHPQDQTVVEGTDAIFFGEVVPPPNWYQWYENDVAIAGATSNSLTITAFLSDDGNYYNLRADTTNSGILTSDPATLTVVPAAAVPEPATSAVWGIGMLLGLLASRRRRRR